MTIFLVAEDAPAALGAFLAVSERRIKRIVLGIQAPPWCWCRCHPSARDDLYFWHHTGRKFPILESVDGPSHEP